MAIIRAQRSTHQYSDAYGNPNLASVCPSSRGRFTQPDSLENWDDLYKYDSEAQRSKLTSNLNVCPTSAAVDS